MIDIDDISALAERREVILVGLLLAVALLLWVAKRVRKIAQSERPDDTLSNVVMLIGLGWSSEAVWEIARVRLGFPLGLTLLLFFIFESMLTLAMIRAKRHMRDHGWPGRSGTTAWTIAACMALVALAASDSFAEAVLRMVIPLLVVKQWWDGLVGGAAKRPADASTWRWTPRRVLLALGAIEPGDRDVQSVHREQLTQQMTRLYHRYKHGSARLQTRRAARLARLSLTADDAIITEVQRRGDRALWFEQNRPHPLPVPAAPDVPNVPALTSTTTPPSRPPVPMDVLPPAVDTPTVNPAPALPVAQESARPSEPDSKAAPTPDVIAARITKPTSTSPDRSTATSLPVAPAPRPRPHKSDAPAAAPLPRPATGTPVTEPDVVQLELPTVAPDLLERAREAARQYRAENDGEQISTGQLAARLRINSEQAVDALTHLISAPIPAVNGRRPSTATR
ncbi:hypothetical protein [Actinoplanes derwentensis]|uniref:Uncharacterized protein n=1 Tax=Actinoplanes derwentensis TaxID=113562 RepID=A0A1H1ZX63_9ACTN|nr:hypothetical protein [Actinoplanes derwentensis]GID83502.1 hypothetical protein Ade03nite_24260 [Actinoplanes derwentensis]SDT38179.1 hypothetical protein SAMN04489716_3540 [Actinoplanes derwentensis]